MHSYGEPGWTNKICAKVKFISLSVLKIMQKVRKEFTNTKVMSL
jgi:hypothetical protein